MAALGADTGISKSEVSRICAGLAERVAAFRGRNLDHVEFRSCISTPPMRMSATTLQGQVAWSAVEIARGITINGDREVLDVDISDSEDATFWIAFLAVVEDAGPLAHRVKGQPEVGGEDMERSGVPQPALDTAGWDIIDRGLAPGRGLFTSSSDSE